MDHNIMLGIWKPPIGARIRIGFGQSKKAIHGVLWFQILKDGSIYMGPRNPDYKFQKSGSKKSDGKDVFIGYDEGDPIEDTSLLKNPKLSFHASGVVHAGGKRSFREVFRKLDRRELVCQILLQNPKGFPVLEKINKYDICIDYPISDEFPIICNIYVSPLNKKFPLLEMQEAKYQVSTVLEYQGLDILPDIAVQIMFFHIKKGSWPPYTYIIWKAGGGENNKGLVN